MILNSLLKACSKTDTEKESCTLCHQPVDIKGFVLLRNSQKKYFCCEGCLSIYKVFYKNLSRSN